MVDTPSTQRAAHELGRLYHMTPEEFIRSSAPGGKMTTAQVCATGLVGTILFARDFYGQGDVHYVHGLAKLALDAEGKPTCATEHVAEIPRTIAPSESFDVVALNQKMEEIVRANQKEYESLSIFQKPIVKRMFQEGTGLTVEEWIARAEAMTRALESGTATAQMRADYIHLVRRMAAYIIKQESDVRGWFKDPKQLEIALAALAERKDVAQKLLDALMELERNVTS